jgi:allantoinase
MTERRAGPDHALYAHAPFPDRPQLAWPGGARLALCVFLYVEHWELDPPKGAIYDQRHDGPLGGSYPNYKVHTQFEYGNRVGIFRILDALERHRVPITVAVNAGACAAYPPLMRELTRRDCEFAAHGAFATRLLSSRMSEIEERAAINESIDTIEQAVGRRPRGWIGQDFGESTRTPRLLAEAGLSYVADWTNDDQPYFMNTTLPLVSIPNQAEWDDVQIVWHRKVHPAVHRDGVIEAFERLYQEGASTGMLFGLHLHPWLIGRPHRIGYLEEMLTRLTARRDVWMTTAGAVADHFNASAGQRSAQG